MSPHSIPIVVRRDVPIQDGDDSSSALATLYAGPVKHMDPSVATLCIICDKASSNICRVCGCAYYCSVDCQQSDWPVHRVFCSQLAAFTSEKRPSPEHFRAVYFPVDKTEPEFTWVRYDRVHGAVIVDHDDLDTIALNMGRITVPQSAGFAALLDVSPVLQCRKLGHSIAITGVDRKALGTGPEWLNTSQASLGKPSLVRQWFGPLIHLALFKDEDEDPPKTERPSSSSIGQTCGTMPKEAIKLEPLSSRDNQLTTTGASPGYVGGQGGWNTAKESQTMADKKGKGLSEEIDISVELPNNPIRLLDVGMRDVRHIFDFHQNDHRNPCIVNPLRQNVFCVPAIKITNVQDPYNRKAGVDHTMGIVNVNLPLRSTSTQHAATLPNMIGLSWWVRDTDAVGDIDAQDPSIALARSWANPDARYLVPITVLMTVDSGLVCPGFDTMPLKGSVAVLHVKGFPLDVYHIWAFNDYLDLALVTRSLPSKQGFQIYWQKYKEEKIRAGFSMDSVPSPYDLEDPQVLDAADENAEYVRKLVFGHTDSWVKFLKECAANN
ncbi:hypothetical protein VTK73DRAFT_2675 [Phialemonium thermophilum]|uniref:MYND-type domain-containing protein n=1 Tax=Phialemonium thermophilum TaxID=223376 RepID=A0ABR3X3N9_9PEZI